MSPLELDIAHLMRIITCIEGVVVEYDGDARCVRRWAVDPALDPRPTGDVAGRSIVEIVGPAAEPVAECIRRVHRTGTPEQLENPLFLNGKHRWFVNDLKRIPVGDGHHVILIARDVTDRKEAEAALRLSEERYRLAQRATQDVLWDWDYTTNVFTSATDSFLDEGGPVDVAGWIARIHPDDRESALANFYGAIEGGAASWTGKFRLQHRDGTFVDVLARTFFVRHDGKCVRIVGSWVDLTEVTQLHAQLVQSDRLAALGLLAAGVGHEINNPLCYVRGNIDLALEPEGLPPDELREILTEARDGATRIAEIVKGLRLFSRSEPTATTMVSLAQVLDRSLKMAENDLRHRARLVREYAAGVPLVDVNESQLGQVCLNLVVNASQAISAGNVESNEIRVTTGVDAHGRAFFSVSDTGGGIPPELLDRIFDPFFTTKPVGLGTGIGLSVCMNIIQSMGGELTVASRPNERTIFTVALPVTRALAPRRPESELRVA